jgi:hypothetical protein
MGFFPTSSLLIFYEYNITKYFEDRLKGKEGSFGILVF